ncbi:MAG: methyltransferase [Candidatus Cloacimonetes bacterium]|nr:methyltransferase [Candidatus Cloacimonadota bacterium]
MKLPFNKTIYQTIHGQSVTTDTAFIVKTIRDQVIKEELTMLELGSGNGIISIMLAHYNPKWEIEGIEIQKHLVELSRDNAKLTDTMPVFMEADLREYRPPEKYDLIVSNPPYFPSRKGRSSPNKERAISRHEITCKMPDVLENIKYNLKKTGSAFILYPSVRWKDIKIYAKKVDLKPKKKFFLKRENKEKMLLEFMHA